MWKSSLLLLALFVLSLTGCGSGGDAQEAAAPPDSPPVLQPTPDEPPALPSTPAPPTVPPVILPPPPVATTRTWTVQGQIANGGTFSGSFTYEKDAAPSAEHVHGLTPNAVYTLTTWTFEARPNFTGTGIMGASPVFFTNTGFVDTSELCFNHCFLDPRDVARLVFDNGQQRLVLVFVLPAPHTTLPVEAGDWGMPLGQYLQSGNPSDTTFQYRMVVTDHAISGG